MEDGDKEREWKTEDGDGDKDRDILWHYLKRNFFNFLSNKLKDESLMPEHVKGFK